MSFGEHIRSEKEYHAVLECMKGYPQGVPESRWGWGDVAEESDDFLGERTTDETRKKHG